MLRRHSSSSHSKSRAPTSALSKAGMRGVWGRSMAFTSSGQTYRPYFHWSWAAHSRIGSKFPFTGRSLCPSTGEEFWEVWEVMTAPPGKEEQVCQCIYAEDTYDPLLFWVWALLQPELKTSLFVLRKRQIWDDHTGICLCLSHPDLTNEHRSSC